MSDAREFVKPFTEQMNTWLGTGPRYVDVGFSVGAEIYVLSLTFGPAGRFVVESDVITSSGVLKRTTDAFKHEFIFNKRSEKKTDGTIPIWCILMIIWR